MSQAFVTPLLDIKAFAKAASTLSGRDALENFERLREESLPQSDGPWVEWRARGEQRVDASGQASIWLYLNAQVTLLQTCQRCMGSVQVPVMADRSFRFVATEEMAQEQDDESEEDVLVLSREFDLAALIEDELLMAMPLVPLHEICPTEVKMAAEDPDFEAPAESKPNPFSILAKLRDGKSGA